MLRLLLLDLAAWLQRLQGVLLMRNSARMRSICRAYGYQSKPHWSAHHSAHICMAITHLKSKEALLPSCPFNASTDTAALETFAPAHNNLLRIMPPAVSSPLPAAVSGFADGCCCDGAGALLICALRRSAAKSSSTSSSPAGASVGSVSEAHMLKECRILACKPLHASGGMQDTLLGPWLLYCAHMCAGVDSST